MTVAFRSRCRLRLANSCKNYIFQDENISTLLNGAIGRPDAENGATFYFRLSPAKGVEHIR